MLAEAREAAEKEGRPIQREMYKMLVKQATKEDWAKLINKRLTATTGDNDINPMVGEQATKILKEIKGHTAMAAMKTMMNGWATTRRFHRDKIIKCIFGCDEPDDMTHYWRCSPRWQMVSTPTGRQIDSYKDIFGAGKTMELATVKLIAVAFTTYHSMIKGRPRCIAEADETGDYDVSLRIAAAIAKTVARELRLAV